MSKKNYEAIYTLSPAQQGMLFETLWAPESGIHIEQVTCALQGDIDVSAFERAWQRIIDRHAILRTGFVWKQQDEPLQVVLQRVEVAFQHKDWRGLPPPERQQRLEAHLSLERRRGFEVSRPPLMRMALFRMGDSTHQFVWTYHHILMDGWCRPIIFNELFSFYKAFSKGGDLQLEEGRPYKDYIAWLKKQDLSKAEAFWKKTLQGFTKPTPLGVKIAALKPGDRQEIYSGQRNFLPKGGTSALQALARQHHVTLNTVVQGVWALLLSRYSDERDVVFGATVAGRPPDIEGFESTIGLFINTLPVRIDVPPEAWLWSWLKEIQAHNFTLRQFEYSPADQVHKWSGIPGALPLYESLLVFENYPVDVAQGPIKLSFEIDNVHTKGAQTKYAVTILVTAGSDILFQLISDNRRLNAADSARILKHFVSLLESIANDPEQRLATLLDRIPASEIPRISAVREHDRQGLQSEFVAPRTPIEETLVGIWAEVLGISQIGIHDDFFELGGHSLLATQLISLMRDAFQVDLPMRALFEMPTVAELAIEIARLKGKQTEFEYSLGRMPVIEPDAEHRHEPFALTDVQQAYWVGRSSSFELGNVATHIYLEVESDRIDVERLTRAWQLTIERHDMLRAVVQSDGQQRILEEVPAYQIEVLDLRGRDKETVEGELQAVRERMSHQVLDTEKWPLFEIRASRLSERLYRFHISFDLLIGDAWSFQILTRELYSFYVEPDKKLPALELSFRDCVLAEIANRETETYRRSEQYWFERLSSLAAAPELPLAKEPGSISKPRFVRRVGRMEPERWNVLKRRATRAGLTPSGVLLAAYAEVLSRWSKTQRFIINLTLFNRLPMHPQINEVVGDFTSLTLLEVDNGSGGSFKERARRIQQRLWEDLDHRHVSAVAVMRELARRQSVSRVAMPVVFTSTLNVTGSGEDSAAEQEPAEESGYPIGAVYGISQTPQVWLDFQVSEQAGALSFDLDAVQELFPDGLVQEMFDAYARLLDRLAEDEESWQDNELDLLPGYQIRQHAQFNATDGDLPEGLLHGPFLVQAKAQPDHPAVISRTRTLCYDELLREANQLGRRLRRLGVRANKLVAVVMRKGWEQVVAAIGILQSGAAYLPISADLPTERIRMLLEHSEAEIVVTQGWLEQQLEWPENIKRVCIGSDELKEEDDRDMKSVQTGEDLAYVIYTSGSTGMPKGVMIDHRGALNTIWDINRRYEVKPADRVLALSSMSFDLSVYDVFGSLAAGATIVMPDAMATPDPAHWAEMMREGEVTIWNSVPALMEMMVDYMEGRSERISDSLRLVMMSGDWIPVTLPHRIRKQVEGVKVVSLGGATEASIWSILYEIEEVKPEWKSIPYGHPMKNQRFYVMNERMEENPIWVAGQLFIGGAGLATGYWKDEQKTASSFIEHPRRTERLYRTGDLGRYLPGGEIEFLGREDYQVKVQGYRIELGEIEAALNEHPSVKAAVVTAVGEPRGNKRLAGYVVFEEKSVADVDQLRGFLMEKLPGYMIPSALVALDALPLTPNGKVDRRALPAPDQTSLRTEGTYAAPRSPVEEMLAQIWADVLRLEKVSIHDNLFELGGNSLLATQVISRVRGVFHAEVALRILFETPTVADFATIVESAWRADKGAQAPALVPVPRGENLPLSFAQQRLWFLNQLEPDNPFYNLPVAIRLKGRLNVTALEQTLNGVVQRHEVLRIAIENVDGQPVQVISPNLTLTLPVIDLQEIPGGQREAQARRLATEDAGRPFDLTEAPLLRASLLRIGEQDHVLVLTMHHIISDGWSMGVLIREMAALYKAFCEGTPSPLSQLTIQYADFAHWQRQWLQGEVLEAHLSYWKKQLAGAPPELKLLTDRPRPAVQTYRGATQSFQISEPVSQSLKQLSRRESVTTFMTLLAAFQTLLHRLSAQDDIVVGTPIANRNRAEIEGLVGFFVNTLALRTDLSDDPSFKELLSRAHETALGAYAHQDLPFEMLVETLQPERHMGRSPVFQVMFTLQNAPAEALEIPGLMLTPMDPATGTANFDLTLFMSETHEGLAGSFEYNTDLFDASTIRRMIGHFQNLLEAIASNPDQSIETLPLVTEAERQQLLVEWNDTTADYGVDQTLDGLFEAQVERTPDAKALVYEEAELSYRELNKRANQVARHLQKLGVGPEVLVGICMERSVEMVVGLLGILKSGGAYVPLEPTHPAERLAYMMEDAKVPVLLTQQHLIERLAHSSARVVCLDNDWQGITEESEENVRGAAEAENLAYVIYTSGSTGWPKGAMNTHRGICNRLVWMQEEYGLSEADRVLQKTPFSFDVSVWEFFWPLITGAQLVMARPGGHQDSAYLVKTIGKQGITTLHFVPSMLEVFLQEEDLETCGCVRQVMCSGEALSFELQERFFEQIEAALHNLYGPTEAAIDVTYWECDRVSKKRVVPIGKPIANTQIYILDGQLQPVPVGVAGELHIGGVGLARGYYNKAEMTGAGFIPDPFGAGAGARLYKTGDLARYLEDGDIEYLGRIDNQVKIRGFRIELGEIEAALSQHPAIREAIVVAREDIAAEKRLVAYAIPKQEQEPSVAELRSFLKQKLPDYMLPSAFVMLDEIPLTPNGKIDRRAFPPPDTTRTDLEESFGAPRTTVEEVLAGILAEVLHVEQVGTRDNFFELGGHSLLGTQVISRVRDALKVELPLRSIFDAPTVANLAERVEAARQAEQGLLSPPILPVPRDRELPLSFAQQRLWFLDQLEPGSPFYNLPTTVRLTGRLDVVALEQTLSEVVRRHEVLRTTFKKVDGQPVQIINPAEPVRLSMLDLSKLPDGQREAKARQLTLDEAQSPFDLARGPLIRVILLRLDHEDHIVLLNMHHIVTDGWSIEILLKETALLYDSLSNHKALSLPDLPIQYGDYTHWQREWLQGDVLEAQLAYWKRALAGAPPLLRLPTSGPRPPVQTFRGARQSFALPASVSERLKALSRGEGVTLFMTLLAALEALLYSYTGQEDIVIGTNIANRNRSETDRLIGFFVNTLAIRVDLSGNPSFRQLLAQVREVTLGAHDHQDLPFEKVVEELQPERQLSYPPLFQVLFLLENVPTSTVSLPGLNMTRLDIHTGTSKFDLSLYMTESSGGLGGMLEYNTDLFDSVTIVRTLEDFQALLQEVVANPDSDLASLSGVAREEAFLANDFNTNLEAY